MVIKDRLYIDVSVRNYLKDIRLFFNDSVDSKDIFFYAAALGIKMPTPIEGKKDGFFMTRLLSKDDNTFLYSLLMKENFDLENIDDKNKMYKIAEESANTGFRIIKDMLVSNSPEMMMKSLLVALDEDYEKIKERLDEIEVK